MLWKKRALWSPSPHLTNDSLFRLCMLGVTEYNHGSVPFVVNVAFLKEYFGGIRGDIAIIPHGTDIPERVATDETRGNTFTVCHVGQIGPDKGDRYLQQGWARAFPKIKNARLVFTGRGADLFGEGFETTGLGTANSLNVQCLQGEMANAAAKEKALLESSVYVQSSVTEGWGIPVGEAMAHGVPVIVTNRAGAVDMVTDGADGFVIPIRDPDIIAEKILYFHDNPGEVTRMGKNAREKAERSSWDRVRKCTPIS